MKWRSCVGRLPGLAPGAALASLDNKAASNHCPSTGPCLLADFDL